MPRLPESEVERIKREVSLVRLIEGRGYALIKQGKDLAMRCPLHKKDETPSFIVTPDKNVWHCFGCQRGGSVIDWVMADRGVSFRHACELLMKDAPALTALGEARGAHPAADMAVSADDQAQLDAVIGYYHETLLASPNALEFLTRRGLTHPDVIGTFRLGYANRTLGYRLPPTDGGGAAIRGQLQRVGLIRASGHEHFSGSLVVPVFDAAGNVSEVYGRKVRDDLPARVARHLYLPGPHRGVFNRAGIEGCEEVIVCEALIDALTFWCAGYRHVTSAFGVSGFTDELLDALVTNGTRRVLIAYDRDEAGDTAAARLAPMLAARGIASYRVLFPKGMDANEYARKVAPADKSLGVVLRSAQAMDVHKAATLPMTVQVNEDASDDDTAGDGRGESDLAGKTVAHAAGASGPPPARGVRRVERGCDRAGAADVAVGADAQAGGVGAGAPAVRGVPDDPHASGNRGATAGAAGSDGPSADRAVANAVAGVADAALSAPLPAPATAIEVRAHDVIATFGPRRYRVRGLEKNLSFEVLKVNVQASAGEHLHVDTLDLYQAKARAGFIKQAGIELGLGEAVIGRDLIALLRALEPLQEAAIAQTLKPTAPALPTWSAEDEAQAFALLRDPALVERIVADAQALGVVGEASNVLMGYLACVSRKLDKPLAILIQSTSAAGKSTLMDALLSLMPEAERVHYSAMTGQSLFYLGEGDLKHKILAIAEEEGVRQAAYALKLLQSQGELTIASTGKDPATGKLVTEEYRVQGPVMLFLTTTAIDIDEELLNRCLVLTIDESREQTAAIQARQRAARTLTGLLAGSSGEAVRRTHRVAQALLRPLAVVNPYAEHLTFRSECTRLRRDHAKYLTLIDAIALLHQYQRQIKTLAHGGQGIAYIEVTLDDIALANRLAHEVLGRSLDELPPQTRRVLGTLDALVRERMRTHALARGDVRFTRADARRECALTDTALRVHLERLIALEYVLVRRGGYGALYEYELAFDGEIGVSAAQFVGLIDVAALATLQESAATLQGAKGNLAPSLHPAHRGIAPASQGPETPRNASADAALPLVAALDPQTAPLPPRRALRPYTNGHAGTR